MDLFCFVFFPNKVLQLSHGNLQLLASHSSSDLNQVELMLVTVVASCFLFALVVSVVIIGRSNVKDTLFFFFLHTIWSHLHQHIKKLHTFVKDIWIWIAIRISLWQYYCFSLGFAQVSACSRMSVLKHTVIFWQLLLERKIIYELEW